MTNLSGGWLRGRDCVAAGKVDGGVNRVLLLTDGLANVGITEPAQLRSL
jgi:Ca-activated chloride channel family protein